jgi:hypothetical protein
MVDKIKLAIRNDVRTFLPSCSKCLKEIKNKGIYISYGNYIYHIDCFRTHAKTMIENYAKYKKEAQEHLNKLEPYSKEMICETLEGIGEK